MTYKMGHNLVQKIIICIQDRVLKIFNTIKAPLNTSPDIVRISIFTKFMVRGLDTTYFPFCISKDVIGY